MSKHRLPGRESSAAVRTVKPTFTNLVDAARLRLQRTPWPAVAYALDVDVETLAAWRQLPEWRTAYSAAAQPLRSNVAATLEWVADDPSLNVGRAADMRVVAADLRADRRTALWWMTHAPRPGTFNWKALQPLMRREERRADLGPGWDRRAKGYDVDFDDTHPDHHPDGDPLAIVLQIEARLEMDALLARTKFEPREAEVVAYVLAHLGGEPGYGDLAALACEWGLKPTTVYGYWHKAKEKVRRASPA